MKPHLNYAILVWGYKCNQLVKLQKWLVRIITRSKYNAQTDPPFKRTEILKVANTLDINALELFIDFFMENYHHTFEASTAWRKDHSTRTTQSEQTRTERTRAEYCDNRLRMYLPGLVNSVPLHLWERIATHIIQGFSYGIKYHSLNLYPIWVNHCQLLHLSLQSAIMRCMFF